MEPFPLLVPSKPEIICRCCDKLVDKCKQTNCNHVVSGKNGFCEGEISTVVRLIGFTSVGPWLVEEDRALENKTHSLKNEFDYRNLADSILSRIHHNYKINLLHKNFFDLKNLPKFRAENNSAGRNHLMEAFLSFYKFHSEKLSERLENVFFEKLLRQN